MRFQKLKKQPADDSKISDKVRQRLRYAPETPLKLDIGELVAVSVNAQREPIGNGLSVKAWARWVDKDGATLLDSAGYDIEVDAIATFDVAAVDRHGVNALCREVLLMLLGEDGATHLLEIGQPAVPIWPVDAAYRRGRNIRTAIANAKRSEGQQDAGAVL